MHGEMFNNILVTLCALSSLGRKYPAFYGIPFAYFLGLLEMIISNIIHVCT
jgi:hypothetical protein